jgi:hypothetical protein
MARKEGLALLAGGIISLSAGVFGIYNSIQDSLQARSVVSSLDPCSLQARIDEVAGPDNTPEELAHQKDPNNSEYYAYLVREWAVIKSNPDYAEAMKVADYLENHNFPSSLACGAGILMLVLGAGESISRRIHKEVASGEKSRIS